MQKLRDFKLQNAPSRFHTPRTVLKAPHIDQVPVRQAWALANHDALAFLPRWRRSADSTRATASAHSEMAAVAAGEELIFNVFACADLSLREHAYACGAEHAYACGPYVGRIDLHTWDLTVPRCEIGYMADVRTQGQGLLSEAALCLMAWLTSQGVVRVEAITDVDNAPSIRFAKRLGFEQEGILRAYERDEAGQLRDQVLLAQVLMR